MNGCVNSDMCVQQAVTDVSIKGPELNHDKILHIYLNLTVGGLSASWTFVTNDGSI